MRVVRGATRLPVDVHLMIVEPERHLDAFAKAGADTLSVHVEACDAPPAHALAHPIARQARRRRLEPAHVGRDTALGARRHRPRARDDRQSRLSAQAFLPSVLPKIRRVRELIDRVRPPHRPRGRRRRFRRRRPGRSSKPALACSSRATRSSASRTEPRRFAPCARRRASGAGSLAPNAPFAGLFRSARRGLRRNANARTGPDGGGPESARRGRGRSRAAGDERRRSARGSSTRRSHTSPRCEG